MIIKSTFRSKIQGCFFDTIRCPKWECALGGSNKSYQQVKKHNKQEQ
nr:MAG TPA: antimicrobial protein [Caudoviricetes sp.]